MVERAARKRHPVMMTFTVIAALVGVALLALAALDGSFSRGGGRGDKSLNAAAGKAAPAARQAADRADQPLKDAGQAAKAKAANAS